VIDFSDIPAFKMPTAAELKKQAVQWFEPLDGTCLDQLPPDVLALGPKTHFIDRKIDEAFIADLHESPLGTKQSVIDIARRLDDIFGWENHVTKMSTRSPKDMWSNNGITMSGKQAISWFAGSMRIFDDMVKLSHMADVYTPQICAREAFIPANGIPGSMEFRCFVMDGELIGITDYDYITPQIQDQAFWDGALEGIRSWFENELRPRMHMDTYVFDTVLSTDGWQFIEVNPYGLSDPCFYKDYETVERIGLSGGIMRSAVTAPDPEPLPDDVCEIEL